MNITGKVYKHFKGGLYIVKHIAKDSDTLEKIVVYEDQQGQVWTRSHTEFFGYKEIEGEKVRRFEPQY
jgi:hypothetical protein